MPNFTRNLTIWLIGFVLVVVLYNVIQGGAESSTRNSLAFNPDFLNKVNAGEVADVMIKKSPEASSTTCAPSGSFLTMS